MAYDWDFSVFSGYSYNFLRGVAYTLSLGVISSVLGTLIGAFIGWSLYYGSLPRVKLLLNDAARSLPTLFLIFFFYYFPWKDVFGIEPLSPFASSVAALTVAQAVFTGDLIRGAIANAQIGPQLAARGLGVSERDIAMFILLPDVARQILPGLGAFFVGNLKLASLSSVIGVQEVLFVARTAAGQQFRALEAWVIVAIIYLLLVTPFTVLVRSIENCKWLRRR